MFVSVVTVNKRKRTDTLEPKMVSWQVQGLITALNANVAQPAQRTDLSHLFYYIDGTWKPQILPIIKSNGVRKAKPQGTPMGMWA